MIIEGKPKDGLQKHQQEAYKAVQKAYEQGNSASVVIPTGCGKSFIALQLMADNKDKTMLFLAPTNAIKNQMYNYIAKYIAGEEPTSERPARMIAREYFPHLQIRLYPTLLRVKDEQMEELNADVIIMDELHRTGADKWGEKVNTLLEKNPKAQILGLTATPERMDDKNVVDELFEGKIDYELTLVDALRDGIVKSPTYVKCDYALNEYLDGIKSAIANCKDEQTKKELQERFDKMRKIVDQAEGIPELFKNNIKSKDGKYIIFCKDKEHMDELMENVGEWFGAIDSEPEIYSVYSGEGYNEAKNERTIKKFETSKSEHLKLLFSIEKLNEGLHVEDISGVIMARPTDSRIIYLQQLGRALSSDTSREKTIVFDLVNNYLKNNLDAEVNNRTKGISRGNDGNDGISGGSEPEDIDIFRIQGESLEFLRLLEETQGIINRSNYLSNARAIKEWIEKSGDTKLPSRYSKDEEEKRLGMQLGSIRQQLIKPYMQLKTEKERDEYKEKHPELEEVMEIINEIDSNNIPQNLRNARAIKEWIEKSGDTKPPSTKSKDEEERRLGIALSTIRQQFIKPYMRLKTEKEREEYKENYPELEEIMEIINEIDSNNILPYLKNARAIKEWIEKSEDTNPPSTKAKDEEEKRLGNALRTIRHQLIKPYMELKTEEEKEKYRKKHPELEEVMEIINEIDSNNISQYLRNARAIKEWIEKSGDTKPPSTNSKDEEEKRLGNALRTIRHQLIKPYMELKTEEEKEKYRKKHPELEEVMEIINEIDSNNISPYFKNARAIKEWIEKSGDTKPPSQKSKDEEEKRLGSALSNMRRQLIKPYMNLKTEKEREEYKEKHPELEEVMEIINEIDSNNISPYFKNARAIKEWIEKSGDTKPPSQKSKDEEEKRLGEKLSAIRRKLIKPYMELKTEEEKEEFRKQHTEIDEVLEIITEIDIQGGTKKQKELAILIRQDLEKRQALQEAKELEKQYEQELSKIDGKEPKTNENEGVDLDGE